MDSWGLEHRENFRVVKRSGQGVDISHRLVALRRLQPILKPWLRHSNVSSVLIMS